MSLQPTNEGYFNCLDIWNVFLDYVATTIACRTGDGEALLVKYKTSQRFRFLNHFCDVLARCSRFRYAQALDSLATQILQKIQFKFNRSQLDALDDETLDDDVSAL